MYKATVESVRLYTWGRNGDRGERPHNASKVYVSLPDEFYKEAETDFTGTGLEKLFEQRERAYLDPKKARKMRQALRKIIAEAITADDRPELKTTTLTDKDLNWDWKAGCRCGCSPGFRTLHGSTLGRSIWVKIESV